MPPPPSTRPGNSSIRFVDPPTGSSGNPDGTAWTTTTFSNVSADLNRLLHDSVVDGVRTTCYDAAARAFPADATLSVLHPEKPRSNEDNSWAMDACRYCFFRPLAADPNSTDAWRSGTGQGNHNPHRCRALKRYLCEGGDPSNTPAEQEFLRSCIFINQSSRRPAGGK